MRERVSLVKEREGKGNGRKMHVTVYILFDSVDNSPLFFTVMHFLPRDVMHPRY